MRIHAGPVTVLVAILALFDMMPPVRAQVVNGFDLSDALVRPRQIRSGGPPRDGIPALYDPHRTDVESADGWLDDDDRIMGVAMGDEAVAYPIRILNWHEIVNDIVAGTPVAVTYCPLCGSGVVFDATLDGRRALFGVSGLLYNSDVLLYDRATESLFSQLMMKAITGRLKGTELAVLPSTTTTWAAWKRRHPKTLVLSPALPFGRDYGHEPYKKYRRSRALMFPVKGVDRSRHPKSWSYLVISGDHKLLIAEESLVEASQLHGGPLLRVEGTVALRYDRDARELTVPGDAAWRVIPAYWFALTAFHPDARRIETEDLKAMPR